MSRARVPSLGALGLQNLPSTAVIITQVRPTSEHLTELRAADGKDLAGLCLLARSRHTCMYGRLSTPHIRMVFYYREPQGWKKRRNGWWDAFVSVEWGTVAQ